MKSELSFLLELILDETTPNNIKAKLVSRVKEVEKNYTAQPASIQRVPRGAITTSNPVVAAQSPSMQRVMADNPDLIPKIPPPVTAAAANALAQRAALINGAVKGDDKEKRTSPRKF